MPFHPFRTGVVVSAVLAVASTLQAAVIEKSGEGWVLDTGLVRKEIRLHSGRFLLSSFRNGVSGREHVDALQPSPEFRVWIDGAEVTGATAGWRLAGERVGETAPGVWQLDLKVARGPLEVEKHYVAYAGTPVIREWVTFTNRGSVGFTVSRPGFLAANLAVGREPDVELSYVTGGGNFNGSQQLKTEPMRADTNRLFDSKLGVQDLGWYSAYLPLLIERNRRTGDGIVAGWDYLGHWALHVGVDPRAKTRDDLSLQVAGYSKLLPPGGTVETPKAFIGAFTGDIDSLGNLILDWQYRYFWNETNDAYFARTRWAVDWKGDWLGTGGTPSGDNWGHRLADDLRYIDLMREAGGEILWDDAGWYDKYGSWRGPDWRQTTDYLAKYGMKWVLWYPTFLATPTSRVAQEHPEWMAPGSLTLEQSIPATVDWQFRQLSEGVRQWGAFQWRNDGTPGFSANDTDFLQGDRNFRTLVERFKQAHPDCGVDACAGGGRWISYDLARLAESGEYTDGGVGPYSAYYTSLIVPPDKLHNVIDADHKYYNPGSDHVHLCMDPTWYKDPGDGPDVEAIRKDWDLYRYLRSRGVVGRWSHVFRPAVTGDEPIWYFQRMNQAGSEGLIIIKHAHRGPVYRLTAKRVSGGAKDYVFGAPDEMNRISTTRDAELDAGVYQDPTDGKPGYYGWGGEAFGPVNFRYTSCGPEKSFVTDIVRNGAPHLANDRFFGISFQTAGKPIEVSQLGLISRARDRWLEGADNSGKYRLSLARADNGSEVASAEIDLSKGHPDRFGFKYAPLAHPVRLDPGPGAPVVIRPAGLSPAALYDVRCAISPYRAVRTGADLMQNGINLATVEPGELIFLNLPRRPGAGTDTVPPSAPGDVTMRIGTNLGVQGVEISWKPAHDDNWISYYEILHDGRVIGRAATGTYYFDHSAEAGSIPWTLTGNARHLTTPEYSVRAVDGDGNRGPAVAAALKPGDPPTMTSLGSFGPLQGGAQWFYEESLDGVNFRRMSWDNAGYEGAWSGSGRASIGRIWMEPGAQADVARLFVAPFDGEVSIEAPVRKDVSANNGETVAVEVTLNGRRIWPESGPGRTDPDPDKELPCHLERIPVKQSDHIRFIAHRTGSNDPNPIIWAPKVVIEPAARKGPGTY